MCCAASEIENCVIVMVQLYCWVFTFVVFVGDGWMALVPAHLPHLRVLGLNVCRIVNEENIEQLVAAMPELVVIDGWNSPVGAWKGKVPYKLMDCNGCFTHDGYDVLRKWALEK
jgi:hypothetical protein